ncbi:MAG: STAS domain-containing protein [Phycisphaerae bacterium]
MDAQGKVADGSALSEIVTGVEQVGGCTVVRLRGELNVGQRGELERVLRELFETTGTRVVLDCAALGFVASAGLGTLVGMQKLSRQKGGSLCMAAARGPIVSLMKMTRLEQVIPMFESVEQAIAADVRED